MENKCKVLLLNTEGDYGRLSINSEGKIALGSAEPNDPNWNNCDLYFVSEDDIKIGDWCVSTNLKQSNQYPYLATEVVVHNSKKLKSMNKIIATTNRDLNQFGIPVIPSSFTSCFVSEQGIDEVCIENKFRVLDKKGNLAPGYPFSKVSWYIQTKVSDYIDDL